MPRFARTLTLTIAALGMLATTAAAAPSEPARPMHDTAGVTQMHDTAGMTKMHGTAGMTQMHDADGMTKMHAQMGTDPAMQAHLARYGIDPDEMDRWHDEGLTHEQIHAELGTRGIDVDRMQSTCPLNAHRVDVAGHDAGTMHGRPMTGHAAHHGR